MSESWASRRTRWLFNWFPAYRSTGARIRYIASDWSEVRISLPLSWRTRNYVGTIFGGSMYGAIDPIYMVMLIRMLGPEFIVWDKAGSIRFLRPGRTTLTATFRLTPQVVEEIRDRAVADGRTERDFEVDLVDRDGVVHARAIKTVHIRWRGARGGSEQPGPRSAALP